ncbi:MAG: hypothetical protein KGL38_09650 [Gemmatimonadota bacterium]|nr:hypothetical protein [Gemmatimonadota bacterium]MDE3128263.1 hypothetical protein [Gemmatimonadota bacterium]MDE3173371.1 hypothetical protein [Gemmatimonadota bacterium]MDE3173692.1 hypothetical protein [Gemmatimonadota bacterium]MDE3215396.1 hypothetical protein [Gemmatimonadota bacterium]
MRHEIIGIVVAVVLFTIYGLVPHRACTGHCEGCSGGSCDRWNSGDHHVV